MSDRDNNYYQLPESDRDYDGLDCNPPAGDPTRYDDLLKISAKRNVTVRYFKAEGDGSHYEDGIDLNRECRNVILMDGRVGAGQKGVAVTIKGGSSDIKLVRQLVTRPGRHCDIEIGNHSDQSWKSCDGIELEDCLRSDGQPVRVAWGRGSRPKIIGGNVRIVWWWTAVLHLYVYAKHWFPRLVPVVALAATALSLSNGLI